MAQQQDPQQNKNLKDQPERSFGSKDRGIDNQQVNTGRSQQQTSPGATEADEDLISSDDRRSSTTSKPVDPATSGSKKAF